MEKDISRNPRMTAATSKPPEGEKKTREKEKKDAPPTKVLQGGYNSEKYGSWDDT